MNAGKSDFTGRLSKKRHYRTSKKKRKPCLFLQGFLQSAFLKSALESVLNCFHEFLTDSNNLNSRFLQVHLSLVQKNHSPHT